MRIDLKQRIISGITAFSILSSSLFPAATVFSEEMPTSETALTSVSETVTETETQTDVPEGGAEETMSDTETSVTESTTEGEQTAYTEETPITDNVFAYSDATVDISLTVNNGEYSLASGSDVPKEEVSFFAYEVSVDDQTYALDVDRRVNIVRAYNTLFGHGTERVVAFSDDVRVNYTFTDSVPEEYAASVSVYTIRYGQYDAWTKIDTDYPVIEDGSVKSVAFNVTLPEFDMFCVVWTDPESVKPDEAILSSDRSFDGIDDRLTATATAFTGAVFTGVPAEGDDGYEYGSLPENANNTCFKVDEIDEDDERYALFDIREGETVYVYAPRFYSEKYDTVTVSDFETEVTYTLSEPVPEDKAYSVMAFVPGSDHMTMAQSEKITEDGYIKGIRFTVKGDVFAVFENISLSALTVTEEDRYSITVKYDKGAQIPDGAELRVTEENAEDYIEDTADALGWSEEDHVCYTRFFDITIVKDGVEYEPVTPVIVTADLHDVEEAPEALQVVHIDEDGAREIEIGSADNAQITFETESFSVYGFGSALHTVISESTDNAGFAVYSAVNDNSITAVEADVIAPAEGLEIEKAYTFEANNGADMGKLWVKADVAPDAGLDERESIAIYSVQNDVAAAPIINDISAADKLCPLAPGVDSIALVKDSGLRRKSLDMPVDGENSGKSVKMDGMMPKASQGHATDVTSSFSGDLHQNVPDQNLLAAYDLSILENTVAEDGTASSVKYQPGEAHPVHVEITDSRITGEDITLYHISGDGTCEEIEGIEVSEGKISFDAIGFSVYQIVEAKVPLNFDETALATLDQIEEGVGYHLSIFRSSTYYMTADQPGVSSSYSDGDGEFKGNTNKDNGAVWYFEKAEGENDHYLYSFVEGVKKYISVYETSKMKLDATEKTIFTIAQTSNNAGTFYIKQKGTANLALSVRGVGNIFLTNRNNGANNNERVVITPAPTYPNDYFDLDGKTFSMAYYKEGVKGVGILSELQVADSKQGLKGTQVLVKPDVVGGNGELLIAKDVDLAEWTFESKGSNNYYIKTEVGGETKYLTINGSNVSLGSTPTSGSLISVTSGTGDYAGKYMFSVGSQSLTLPGGDIALGFIGSSNGGEFSYINLVDRTSVLTEDDFTVYSAEKVDISDRTRVPNGAQLVIFCRLWNDDRKKYEQYIVNEDGTLVRAYESGNVIQWVGSEVNTMLWDLTEYLNDKGEPNYFYDLQNTYSEKYISPKLQGDQVVSNERPGINLMGRKDGYFYSKILVWDGKQYKYIGLKTQDRSILMPCEMDEAEDFYFAMIVPTVLTEPETVETLDNSLYGITMKMADLDTRAHMKTIMGNDEYKPYSGVKDLLSTDLEDGYPTTKAGKSLSEMYADAVDVNHLFIANTYYATGYFTYDSAQNFASFYDKNGTLDPNDFTVYRQLGTSDSKDAETMKHGLFLPYNKLSGTRSSKNPWNLYAPSGEELPDSDPRKGEDITLVATDDGTLCTTEALTDYFFAMELEAKFTQTANGLDAWGHDMIFEFTGDDDFWLYIDDQLVLDLGGIHSALSGDINFRTGIVHEDGDPQNEKIRITKEKKLIDIFEANYRDQHKNATDTEVQNYLDGIFEEKDGHYVFQDYTSHKMKIFYMERGAGSSNLKLRFNLASIKPGTVLLSKELSGVNEADSFLAEYPFQIWYKEVDGHEAPLAPDNDLGVEVVYKDTTKEVTFRKYYDPNDPTVTEAPAGHIVRDYTSTAPPMIMYSYSNRGRSRNLSCLTTP